MIDEFITKFLEGFLQFCYVEILIYQPFEKLSFSFLSRKIIEIFLK